MKLLAVLPIYVLSTMAILLRSALAEVPSVPTPEPAQGEIQLPASANGTASYFVPTSLSVTGMETPIRDVPFSIQVVPQPVIRDRNVTTLGGALQTVPGVVPLGRQR